MADNENGFNPFGNSGSSEPVAENPAGTGTETPFQPEERQGTSFDEDYRTRYAHYNDYLNRERQQQEEQQSQQPPQPQPQPQQPQQPVNGEYAIPHPQGGRTDFSRYNDGVAEPPKVETEPVYSPYSDRTAYRDNPAGPGTAPGSYGPSGTEAPVPKKKKKGFGAFIAIVLAVALIVSTVLGLYGKKNKVKSDTDTDAGSSKQNVTLNISDSPASGEKTNSVAIAEKAQKFNVGILLYGSKISSFGFSSSSSASGSLVGEGSGIIMSEEGDYTYILTCAHVISGVKASGYTMTVQDYKGNRYDGYVVGSDAKTDIGVIKIKAKGLTAAQFGDSSKLVIGQQVYAIGNPGGVEFFGSFTNGMVSAIDRPISSESGYEMNCIQHTTPINSGNSGGALLNESGQVIGINSSKIVSTGYEGMAFAIPISDAKPIIDDLISNGHVSNRAKLGISYLPVSAYNEYQMIVSLKELPAGSLIIAKISSDSALKDTDAQIGDMIIAANGKELENADVLLDIIEKGKVGDSVKLTLCRIEQDYKVKTFDVTVKLVEDDGTGSETEQTTTSANDFYNYFFGNGGW